MGIDIDSEDYPEKFNYNTVEEVDAMIANDTEEAI
jgi:hypothetical protein